MRNINLVGKPQFGRKQKDRCAYLLFGAMESTPLVHRNDVTLGCFFKSFFRLLLGCTNVYFEILKLIWKKWSLLNPKYKSLLSRDMAVTSVVSTPTIYNPPTRKVAASVRATSLVRSTLRNHATPRQACAPASLWLLGVPVTSVLTTTGDLSPLIPMGVPLVGAIQPVLSRALVALSLGAIRTLDSARAWAEGQEDSAINVQQVNYSTITDIPVLTMQSFKS